MRLREIVAKVVETDKVMLPKVEPTLKQIFDRITEDVKNETPNTPCYEVRFEWPSATTPKVFLRYIQYQLKYVYKYHCDLTYTRVGVEYDTWRLTIQITDTEYDAPDNQF